MSNYYQFIGWIIILVFGFLKINKMHQFKKEKYIAVKIPVLWTVLIIAVSKLKMMYLWT